MENDDSLKGDDSHTRKRVDGTRRSRDPPERDDTDVEYSEILIEEDDDQLISLIETVDKNRILATSSGDMKTSRRWRPCLLRVFVVLVVAALVYIIGKNISSSFPFPTAKHQRDKKEPSMTPDKEKLESEYEPRKKIHPFQLFSLNKDKKKQLNMSNTSNNKSSHSDAVAPPKNSKPENKTSQTNSLLMNHTFDPSKAKENPPNTRIYPKFECDGLFKFSSESEEENHYYLSHKKIDDPYFLKNYRNSTIDQSDTTYEELKEELYNWKVARFAKNLKDGDAIYESGSGLGLNLVLTLEIVKEVTNISTLVVYGNDLSFESTYESNRLISMGILPSIGRKGIFCQGDSKNLSWVPSDSFDLVFTGFLPPLKNPLDFDVDDEELQEKYAGVCKKNTKKKKSLVKKMTEIQEDWYSQWVSEMIRVAKPGVPVIVERVTNPVCVTLDEMGGVSKHFWERGVENYGWDIDPESIEIESDEDVYHVFMRKNE